MIDSILSLSINVHSNKGVYALLLGSGISSSAGILTGWEIVKDLIIKLAKLQNEVCDDDPINWYISKYKKEPDYSELLEEISKTPAERNKLLRSYFEPTDEEFEDDIKVPTKAHESISNLISLGYIKVIITTNFDRLLEKALDKVNIVPSVISTTDSIDGALPIVHSKCTIIKVNGDYLDTRIKNTPKELEKYDKKLNKLLDTIFDEFGLIVCGWSGEWDDALRFALERNKNRRFTKYWSSKGKITDDSKKLIDLLGFEIIANVDADTLFTSLLDNVIALSELDKPHPTSSRIAIEIVKKYIAEEKYLIKLNDIIINESRNVVNEIRDENFNLNDDFSQDAFIHRVKKYETILEILINMHITISYWSNKIHYDCILNSLELIANPKGNFSGNNVWIDLKWYPGLLLYYSIGIASLANNNYELFSFISKNTIISMYSEESPIYYAIDHNKVLEKRYASMLPGRSYRDTTPFNDYLHDILLPHMLNIIPNENNFTKYFDKFEYLKGLMYANRALEKNFWDLSTGSFVRRIRRYPERHISKIIENEINDMDDEWRLLKFGLFNNSVERLKEVKEKYDEHYFRS